TYVQLIPATFAARCYANWNIWHLQEQHLAAGYVQRQVAQNVVNDHLTLLKSSVKATRSAALKRF
ncbi:hypothetical protein D5X65_24750, partial [Salmonella enterica subsp. enterica serovar Suberu]|nr:hypothetical protein [Salmonella enterica subsp. enterica serovar Suberu]